MLILRWEGGCPCRALGVLVVEDDPGIAEAVVYALERDGMHARVAGTLAAARRDAAFDVAGSSISVSPTAAATRCWASGARGTGRPVIVLTSRDGEIDCVASLEAGADDFVAKPFSPRALVARVRAVLRRGTADRPLRRCRPRPPPRPARCVSSSTQDRQFVRDAPWRSRGSSSSSSPCSPARRDACTRATSSSRRCGAGESRSPSATSTPTSRRCGASWARRARPRAHHRRARRRLQAATPERATSDPGRRARRRLRRRAPRARRGPLWRSRHRGASLRMRLFAALAACVLVGALVTGLYAVAVEGARSASCRGCRAWRRRRFVLAVRAPRPVAAAGAALVGRRLARPVEGWPTPPRASPKESGARAVPRTGDRDARRITRALVTLRREVESRPYAAAFLRDAWHDLKTPLAAIRASVEVLEDGALDDPCRRAALRRNLSRAAAELDRRLGDLVTLARMETATLAGGAARPRRRGHPRARGPRRPARDRARRGAAGGSLGPGRERRVRCDPARSPARWPTSSRTPSTRRRAGACRVSVDGAAREGVLVDVVNEPADGPARAARLTSSSARRRRARARAPASGWPSRGPPSRRMGAACASSRWARRGCACAWSSRADAGRGNLGRADEARRPATRCRGAHLLPAHDARRAPSTGWASSRPTRSARPRGRRTSCCATASRLTVPVTSSATTRSSASRRTSSSPTAS